MEITLGTFAPHLEPDATIQLSCADPQITPHLGRPWFQAALAKEVGQPIRPNRSDRTGPVPIPDWVLARPMTIFGKSGSGKSRASEHLLLQRFGAWSLVFIDGKGEGVQDLRALIRAHNIPKDDVTIIDAANIAELPGSNPFLADIPPEHIAADLGDAVDALMSGPAPRSRDILEQAACITATHKLSPYDAVAFLQHEAYRAAILRMPPPIGAGAAFMQAVHFFTREFGMWGKSERTAAVAPILNKVRSLVTSDPLLVLLSARKNSVNFSSFFFRPQILLVSLNRAVLGDTAARLATALLLSVLYRTALRLQGQGAVPCVLQIDELPIIARMAGNVLIDILTTGRSLHLPLVVALQHFGGISEQLRSAIFGNVASILSFALSYEDAHTVATALAAGREGQIERLALRATGRLGELETTSWSHPILDSAGQTLRINTVGWEKLAKCTNGQAQVALLYEIAKTWRMPRLYVRSATTGNPIELRRYARSLAPEDYWLSWPRLALVVSFPKPYIASTTRTSAGDLVRRYTRIIQELPPQHLVSRIGVSEPRVVRVADLTIPDVPNKPTSAGDTSAQVKALISWHEERIVQRCRGTVQEEEDGSIS